MISEYCNTQVSFSLPDWVTDDRFEHCRHRFYGPGHAWEGQIESTDYPNQVQDGLHRLKEVTETCFHPMGPSVTAEFTVAPRFLPRAIDRFHAKLERYLSRFRESKQVA